MTAFLRGFFFVLFHPRLWGALWKPMLFAAILYIGILLLGVYALDWMSGFLFSSIPWLERLITYTGSAVLVVMWFFFAGPIWVFLTSFLSSFLWESLSLKVEEEFKSPNQHKTLSHGAVNRKIGASLTLIILDGCVRVVIAMIFAILSLLLSSLGPIPAALAAGMLGLLDFSAPAYLRRGIPVWKQWKRVQKHREILGFIFLTSLVSIIPILFLFLLPAMVAGATIFCIEAENSLSEHRDQ